MLVADSREKKHTEKKRKKRSKCKLQAENLLLISCASSVDGVHLKLLRKLACEQLFYSPGPCGKKSTHSSGYDVVIF